MKEVIMQVASYSSDYPKAPIYVADLVRCKECKHREEYPCKVYHDDDWFCADGEREGE